MDVSTPGSPSYGKHLSLDEVEQITQTKATSPRLLAWAKSAMPHNELVKMSPRGEYIRIKAPVEVLESVLGTKFYYYKDTVTSSVAVRAEREIRLPKNIASLVHTVFRTVDFPPLLKGGPKATKKGTTVEGRALSEPTNLISP